MTLLCLVSKSSNPNFKIQHVEQISSETNGIGKKTSTWLLSSGFKLYRNMKASILIPFINLDSFRNHILNVPSFTEPSVTNNKQRFTQ